eukprot:CAMPEP_0177672890 /NCGR_PEP_ID=MMETSP0447-20121125/25609_1 /TAXON_ID=0 /ORGANISM="Stygamoeba regulata, Strain BSH-02190019" /LENGTH=43 /DNA_ID= /DNA_START= /DNA_END= /DNA_ORIENTATION=
MSSSLAFSLRRCAALSLASARRSSITCPSGSMEQPMRVDSAFV